MTVLQKWSMKNHFRPWSSNTVSTKFPVQMQWFSGLVLQFEILCHSFSKLKYSKAFRSISRFWQLVRTSTTPNLLQVMFINARRVVKMNTKRAVLSGRDLNGKVSGNRVRDHGRKWFFMDFIFEGRSWRLSLKITEKLEVWGVDKGGGNRTKPLEVEESHHFKRVPFAKLSWHPCSKAPSSSWHRLWRPSWKPRSSSWPSTSWLCVWGSLWDSKWAVCLLTVWTPTQQQLNENFARTINLLEQNRQTHQDTHTTFHANYMYCLFSS